ncbi:MAG: hypothetical protein ACYC91_10130 [Solirubrobacteraceae bacterium]
MNRNLLLTDGGIALGTALIVIMISPGLAIDAILALLVLALCTVSFVRDGRRRRAAGRRSPRAPEHRR